MNSPQSIEHTQLTPTRLTAAQRSKALARAAGGLSPLK